MLLFQNCNLVPRTFSLFKFGGLKKGNSPGNEVSRIVHITQLTEDNIIANQWSVLIAFETALRPGQTKPRVAESLNDES